MGERTRKRGVDGSVGEGGYYPAVVVGAAFVAHFFTCGMALSLGVYYVTFLEAFGQGSGATAWIGSLNYGTLCAAGPIGSILMNRYSVRVAITSGGMIASLGLLISAFAPNIYVLFLSLGLITGFGFGLVFTASIVMINLYVTTMRGIANGIAVAGIGLGNFCQPLIHTSLIDHYGWRGALLIGSALTLHAAVAGVVIRPLPPKQPISIDEKKSDCALQLKPRRKLLRLKMFRRYEYWILWLNCMFFCFGLSVVYTHTAAFAKTIGYSAWHGTVLLSAMGLANLAGRLLLGAVITFIPSINVHVLFGVNYAACGLSAIAVTSFRHFQSSLLVLCVFGFGSAAYGPVLNEVLVVTVGLEYYPSAYGILLIPQAIGTILGAPSAGWLYEATDVYANSFYLGGATLVASGVVVMIPVCARYLSPDSNERQPGCREKLVIESRVSSV